MNDNKELNKRSLNAKEISDQEYRKYEKIVKQNIDFDLLMNNSNPELVAEIVQIILDIVCSTKEKFRVNGCDTSASIIKSRF